MAIPNFTLRRDGSVGKLSGVMTVMITPLKSDGSVDYEGFKKSPRLPLAAGDKAQVDGMLKAMVSSSRVLQHFEHKEAEPNGKRVLEQSAED